MQDLNITKPDYDIAIFKVLPTILVNNLGLDLREPYGKQTFRDNRYLKHFEDCDINLVVIIDSLSVEKTAGFLEEIWSESGKLVLSSIVPSTTANAVGSIYLGVPPETSGLVSTRFYSSEIETYVNALYGITIEDEPKYLADLIELEDLLWEKSVLGTVAGEDLEFIDILPNFIRGGLKRFYDRYTVSLRYESTLDSVFTTQRVAEYFARKEKRGVIFLYIYHLDSLGHKYGYGSEEWITQEKIVNDTVMLLLEKLEKVSREYSKCIRGYIISDHGQVNVNRVLSIREDDAREQLSKMGVKQVLKSDRFASLHTQGEQADIDSLNEYFEEVGKVITIEEAIKIGLWPAINEENREKFVERLGEYIFLPYKDKAFDLEREIDEENESVVKKKKLLEELGLTGPIGRHGGLTESEMRTPFIPFNLGE